MGYKQLHEFEVRYRLPDGTREIMYVWVANRGAAGESLLCNCPGAEILLITKVSQ